MFLKYYRKKIIDFNKKIDLREEGKNFYSFTDKNLKFILTGKFYYYNSLNSKSIFFNANPEKQLRGLIKKYNLENFINNVEGEYWGVKIDYRNKSLTIFSDKLKQLELYYFYDNDIFLASEDPKEILNEIKCLGYDENSLINAILLYVPKGHTIFKGTSRLKYNEIIIITQNKISIRSFKDKDIKIRAYSEKDLFQHNAILKDAILSRASNSLNLVFSSGGWDSTLILSILREYFGKDKVRSITMKVILSDGRCFNKFEVDKVKKIGKILGIKTDIIEIDYRKKELYYKFDEVTENLFFKNLFFLAPANWSKAVSYIRKKYGKDIVVFQGEGADSLYNYGFSQYISLPHDDISFTEYADKMKSYLFSPAFFKKIMNNTFLDDVVYKIFLNLNQNKEFIGVKNFDIKKRIYYYLMAFIFSDIRVPFRKVACKKYIKDSAFKNFEKWLKKEYFQEVIENINESNLYYYFSHLYTLFHLQSPQVRIFRTGLDNIRFPYIDLSLFKFLYKMPQNFGRGLDFNPTKFPLKELAKKIFPETLLKIIESTPHSYLSEIEDINIYDEYLLKGSVSEYMRDKIDFKKVRKIFGDNLFYTNEIENLIKRFKQGKMKNLSPTEARFLIILTPLSICS